MRAAQSCRCAASTPDALRICRYAVSAQAPLCGGVPHSSEPLLTVPWGAMSVRYGKDPGTFGGMEVFGDHVEVRTGMGAFERKRVLPPGPVDAYRAAERVLVIRLPEADVRLNIHSMLFTQIDLALSGAGFEICSDGRRA